MSSTAHAPTNGVSRVDYGSGTASPASEEDTKAEASSPDSMSEQDTDTWSIFTEAHAEGQPRKIAPWRTPSHDEEKRSKRQSLHRLINNLRLRSSAWSDDELTHPLCDEKTTGAALVEFGGDDDPYR